MVIVGTRSIELIQEEETTDRTINHVGTRTRDMGQEGEVTERKINHS